MDIETQILAMLVHEPTYARVVLPYLKPEYFHSLGTGETFKLISSYATKYDSTPSVSTLKVEANKRPYTELVHGKVIDTLDELGTRPDVDQKWLIDETEGYCKQRALTLALQEAIEVTDDDKRENGEIVALVQKDLSISFDSELGHDLFDDAERRFDDMKAGADKLPFLSHTLNQATQGGVEVSTLNMIMAGCVNPNTTTVIAKYKFGGIDRERAILLKDFLPRINAEEPVFVLSPSGYVEVLEWVDKGIDDEYLVITETNQLSCNGDHLIQTPLGWERVEEIARLQSYNVTNSNIMTRSGMEQAGIVKTGNKIPVVDLILKCDHHSYYTNDILSHNTNVGKTLIMCSLAADDLRQGRRVLYITLEMSQKKIANRIEANLIDVHLDDFKDMPKDWYLGQIAKIKAKTTGRIKIKEYPSGTANVNHFKHYIQELQQKEGFIPDVVYIDYINICASSVYKAGSVAGHVRVAGIADEFRSLGQQLKVPVFSATQLNRQGFNNSDASMTDISESFGLTFIVDWLIMVIETPELEELGQYMFKQEKSRYADKNKLRQFVMGVTKGKQRLFDIDEQPYLAGNHAAPKEEKAATELGAHKFFGDPYADD
jgi:replicative DNA helicase